uniref:Uncharacterized protein n=1 Tax=Parastrongyloides trichosuri TaxID=131310 RepID=A0A0N4Z4Q6_PARTI
MDAFENEILSYLYSLWKLQHDVSGIEEIVISPEAIEGTKFLMVLKSINIYQNMFESSKSGLNRNFYSHLFATRNPKDIMLKLNDGREKIDQYDIALFADTVNVKIHLFDFTLKNVNKENICSIYPSPDSKCGSNIHMVKLNGNGPILSLYHVPDDIFFS